MIEIDGSFGEGGGQIIRTALSLSCLYGIPFHIRNIRANRKKPGLMPQHLTSVAAAAEISGATVHGATVGATELTFIPAAVRPGNYRFDIGTAGSTSLVLQTLIPPLIMCSDISRIIITGGTHVPVSPPFQFLERVFVPALARLGVQVNLTMARPGFYPRGGGEISAVIHPAGQVHTLQLLGPATIEEVEVESAVAGLPASIAERQRDAALRTITPVLRPESRITSHISTVSAASPGTFIFIRGQSSSATAGFFSTGARGKRAEQVGAEAAEAFAAHYRTGAPIDPHLADQLVIYLSLAAGTSAYATSCVTSHLLTNLHVIRWFRRMRFAIDGKEGEPGVVTVQPD